MEYWLSEEVVTAGTVETFKRRLEELRKKKKVLLMDCMMFAKTKADTVTALVRPNQVNK